MTRQNQARFPARQTPLCERIYLAADAAASWRPDETWRDWCDWLPRPPTTDVYRSLRRATVRGRESWRSLRELGRRHRVSAITLLTILDELAELHLIQIEREHGTTVVAVEVCDPPPVPDNIDSTLHLFVYNRLPVSRAEVNAFLRYWGKKYLQHRKHNYHGVRGKDRVLVRGLLETYGLDELKRLAWYLLHSGVGDDVIPYKEVSIGTFVGRIDRIIAEKAADEQPSARIS